jgi:hypothetical protein
MAAAMRFGYTKSSTKAGAAVRNSERMIAITMNDPQHRHDWQLAPLPV